MDLPVPPSQAHNVFSNREEWADFVDENVLRWKRRLTEYGPDELRDARDHLERRIERREEEAEEVLERAGDIAREISGYADLDEEESVQRLRRIVMGVPREMPLTLDGEPVDLWEARDVFSEAAPGDRKAIERLAERHSRLRGNIQQEKFSLRIVEYVHGQYLHGALQLKEGESTERDQYLTSVLTDSERRLKWIGEELMSRGDTWEERYKEMEAICEGLGVTMPYASAESLRKSYNQSKRG